MTVAELIEKLSQYDPDLPVVIKGYEGGYNDLSIIEEIRLQLNANTENWYGTHEEITNNGTAHRSPCEALRLAGLNPNCEDPQYSLH